MITPGDISLCSIYRNEERLLPSFLEHHRNLFGEIILVDTGSDDQSNDIIDSAGLTHHSFPWTGNFSEARNHSIGLAAKPYICVLDIDEILLSEDLERAVRLLSDGDFGGLSLCQINLGFHPQNSDWLPARNLPEPFCRMAQKYTVSRLIRIFRNDPRVRFQGAVHEVVGHSLHTAGYNSRITDIPIYHLGWIDTGRSPEEQEEKDRLYREMIRKDFAAAPSIQNGYYLLSLVDTAAERLRIAYDLIRKYPDILDFRIVLALSAAETGQWPRALDYARRGLERFPDSETLKLLEIRALNHCSTPEKALERFASLPVVAADRSDFRMERIKALIMTGRIEDAEREMENHGNILPEKLLSALRNVIERKRSSKNQSNS